MKFDGIDRELRANTTNIEIPNDVTSIGIEAFKGCDNLKYNEYDNGFYLGNKDNPYLVFVKAKDRKIKSCIINSFTKIVYHCAFAYCRNLESVDLPKSVISLGTGIFTDCVSLKHISLPYGIDKIDVGLFNGSGLKGIDIPSNVKSIGNASFCHCKNLVSVNIPRSVTKIDRYAFDFCINLKSVVIPKEVTYIGNDAFAQCDNLTIYCEAQSMPDGWDSDWNSGNRVVIWGFEIS